MHHPSVRMIGLAAVVAVAAGAAPPEFRVRFTPGVSPGPVSARVYVMLGPARPKPGPRAEPRFGPDLFQPQPFFAVEARDWTPGSPLTVGADALGFPAGPGALSPGDYSAQAVVRLNPDTHRIGNGEGNAYGPVVRFSVGPRAGDDGPTELSVDTVVPPRKPPDTERVKYVEIDSPILSTFHNRPVKHRAAVILPEPDDEGDRDPAVRPGTLYIIPGFGGDHMMADQVRNDPRFAYGRDTLRVVLDPDCGAGHHVFADSAYNGPRGKAFVEELVPHIETTFRANPSPRTRLLNGHSSGGWSSLWLQVTYPDAFGGVWSTSPDPVDFRDFQKVDVYAPGENAFRDPAGSRRPIARKGTRAVLFYDSLSKMEDVIGGGGQLGSFEAVFSPLGRDGRPRPLWDRATGAIDPGVALAWQSYDIRLVIERDWDRLRPKLQGKLHVVVGDLDTFYLDGAVSLLKSSLRNLNSDATVDVIPGRDHFDLVDVALARRFDREMAKALGAANGDD